MIPIRIVETEREDFEGPIVELWRDDEFVGMVFWDGESVVVQIYPDEDGEVHDLELENLIHALDTAQAIVDPFAFDAELEELRTAAAAGVLAADLTGRRDVRNVAGQPSDDGGWEQEHPATIELVGEFDPLAAERSEEGEGYFEMPVADRFVRRCEELDLAVVEMEGFDRNDADLSPRPGFDLVVPMQSIMEWAEFRAYANASALDTLDDWADDRLLVAFVVQQPDGETFVA